MTLCSSASAIFIFKTDTSNGDRSEIHCFPHAFHTIVANLFRIKIAAITLTTAIADLIVIQKTHLWLCHFNHLT